MSTTEQEVPSLNGVPLEIVLKFLSERGALELDLAVTKATVALQNQSIEQMTVQITTLDAQVVSMREKHGVSDDHAGDEEKPDSEPAVSS